MLRPARGRADSPTLMPLGWLIHVHTNKASSNVLPRRGAGLTHFSIAVDERQDQFSHAHDPEASFLTCHRGLEERDNRGEGDICPSSGLTHPCPTVLHRGDARFTLQNAVVRGWTNSPALLTPRPVWSPACYDKARDEGMEDIFSLFMPPHRRQVARSASPRLFPWGHLTHHSHNQD